MLLSMLVAASLGAPVHVAATTCSGGGIAVVAAHASKPDVDQSGVAHYKVGVTVKNKGARQPGNALDSVVMYQQDTRTDTKGLQPLAAGATQTVWFSFIRNADTEAGSTNLKFGIEPSSCSAGWKAIKV
jgi:hypothetical protein